MGAGKHVLPIASSTRTTSSHCWAVPSGCACPRRRATSARHRSAPAPPTRHEAGIGDLLHDAAIVYEHVVAPPAIEDDLTPTNQTLGPFADDGGRMGRNAVLHNLGGGGRPARFADWLESIDSSRRPTLYFKHLLLPHVPWEYLPDGRRYSTDPYGNVHGSSDERSFDDRWLLEQAYQRHLLQAGYTDTLLGACWTGCARRASTIARSSSSRPTTARAPQTAGTPHTRRTRDRRGHRLDAVAGQAPRTAARPLLRRARAHDRPGAYDRRRARRPHPLAGDGRSSCARTTGRRPRSLSTGTATVMSRR